MYRKVLLLLDGSDAAEVVFHYARKLSGRLGLDLDLLHVASPEEAEQLPMRRAYIERMADELCTEASEDTLGQCVMARGTVAVGDAAEEILKYIEQKDVDLVMMSTHGRSGRRQFSLGGVANKVVHASRAPVWLVPTELREEVIADTLARRPLVVPLSGSKISEAAIPHALGLAEQRAAESEIVLVHAVPPPPEILTSRSRMDDHAAALRKAEEYLEREADSIRDAGYSARTVLLEGDPAEQIIEFLKKEPAQLVAMATRGRTGLSRMVFGSVTEDVLHEIRKTPLLLVSATDQ